MTWLEKEVPTGHGERQVEGEGQGGLEKLYLPSLRVWMQSYSGRKPGEGYKQIRFVFYDLMLDEWFHWNKQHVCGR